MDELITQPMFNYVIPDCLKPRIPLLLETQVF